MRGTEVCGCFPTGRHYPGIADRLTKLLRDVPGLAAGFEADIVWARAPFVFIDFETTGLDSNNDRIIEVGLACFDQGVITHTENWLVNPTQPISAESVAITGITDDMVRSEPTFDQLWPEIKKALSGRIPAAYNADFDRGFLLAELKRMGADENDRPPAGDPKSIWIDPLVWARVLMPESKSFKLTEIAAQLGVPLDTAHRASHDAQAAGLVLQILSAKMPERYGELLRVQPKYAATQSVEQAFWRRR